jgi:hypothetical protein
MDTWEFFLQEWTCEKLTTETSKPQTTVLAPGRPDERPRTALRFACSTMARAVQATRGEGGGSSDLEGPDRGVV